LDPSSLWAPRKSARRGASFCVRWHQIGLGTCNVAGTKLIQCEMGRAISTRVKQARSPSAYQRSASQHRQNALKAASRRRRKSIEASLDADAYNLLKGQFARLAKRNAVLKQRVAELEAQPAQGEPGSRRGRAASSRRDPEHHVSFGEYFHEVPETGARPAQALPASRTGTTRPAGPFCR
jgi:predicted phage gp36 major capsid-like protein